MSDPIADAQAHVDRTARAVDGAQRILEYVEQRWSANSAAVGQIEQQRHICQWTRHNARKTDANLIAIQDSTSRLMSAHAKMHDAWRGNGVHTAAVNEAYQAGTMHANQRTLSMAFVDDPLPFMPGTDSWKPPWNTPMPTPQRPQDIWEGLVFAAGFVKAVARKLAEVRQDLGTQEDQVVELKNRIDLVLEVEVATENGALLAMLRDQLVEAHLMAQKSRIHCASLQPLLGRAEKSRATAQVLVDTEMKWPSNAAEWETTRKKQQAKVEQMEDVVEATRHPVADQAKMEEMFNNLRWPQKRTEHQEEEDDAKARRAHEARLQKITDRLDRLRAEREHQEEAVKEAEQAKRKAEQAERDAHLVEEQALFNEVLKKLRRREKKIDQEKGKKATKPTPYPKYTLFPKVSPPPKPEQTIAQWRAVTEDLFANYSTMETFPQPPVRRCNSATCVSVSRHLRACSHSIEDAFWRLPNLDVKKERLRWHPDRFSSCPEQHREIFQKMAQEIFVVLEQMHSRR